MSSKAKVNQTGGKTKAGYDVTVVRLKDGATADTWRGILPDSLGGLDLASVNGSALGRVVYVRSFDPFQPPAAVPAGKPSVPKIPPCCARPADNALSISYFRPLAPRVPWDAGRTPRNPRHGQKPARRAPCGPRICQKAANGQ
ncbi:MAG: hypothetical protein MdMp014T_2684 [Treponematales bacterium]